MSVQRWKPAKATARYWSEGMRFDADGAFVTYADHVAATAQAVAEARIEWEMSNGPAFDFARGYAEALSEAREAVLSVVCNYNGCEARARAAIDALAAIEGLMGEPNAQ